MLLISSLAMNLTWYNNKIPRLDLKQFLDIATQNIYCEDEGFFTKTLPVSSTIVINNGGYYT